MHGEGDGISAYLESGRQQLQHAAAIYERKLSPLEYWWLGVGLAACTLAELGEKPYAVGRLEQLVERLGYKGIKTDWLQRFVEELAALDAEGLLWPIYERSPEGPILSTGVEVQPEFDHNAGYFLALAHIAVALAVHREESETISLLARTIEELVERGLETRHERLILESLQD